MASRAFEISNLSLKIDKKKIFTDIHLTIPNGKVTAIVGPSGCGKSSFLSCLNRLITHCKGATLSGHISCCGSDIDSLDETNLRQFRQKVGSLFQTPLPFPTTVLKNLYIPIDQHYQLSKQEKFERAKTALKDVGLWDEVKTRLNSPASELSGGQKQRLCLARALVLDPQVLLMDEPCSALDPLSTAKVDELIKNFKSRLTTVIVTHNIQQAKRIADHVVVFWYDPLKGGHIIEHGSAEKVFTAPKHEYARSYFAGALG